MAATKNAEQNGMEKIDSLVEAYDDDACQCGNESGKEDGYKHIGGLGCS